MSLVHGTIICIFLFCCFVGQVCPQISSPGCPLPVKVQHHFSVERFLGRWNELMWVAPEDEKDYDAADYFWLLGNMTHHGTIPIGSSGRDPSSGQCFGGPLQLQTTNKPGVLLLDTGNGKAATLVYVMKTDYVTYANVYGCYEYNSDASVCHNGRAWLWSRATSLPEKLKHDAVKQWSQLCLDVRTLLKYTPFPGN
ncbi:uncharacterized protein, partial [Littorina saxatilis]|uniref:uncharacterized protein n=1 Tax=Littorina saxatilis TaxID=31220 RepID=UPI0038B5FACB